MIYGFLKSSNLGVKCADNYPKIHELATQGTV